MRGLLSFLWPLAGATWPLKLSEILKFSPAFNPQCAMVVPHYDTQLGTEKTARLAGQNALIRGDEI
jgi:hypothetical protein